MQNNRLVRLAHSILARRRETYELVMKDFQCPCIQRDVSTSAAARSSDETANSLDNTWKSQQAASDATHVAKVVHANELRQLRKKWKAQHAEKLAIKAKADAKKAANKAVMIEGHRRNVAAMKELRGQIHEEKRRLQIAETVRHISLFLLTQCGVLEPKSCHAQALLTIGTCHHDYDVCVNINKCPGVQAQKQALAAQFRSATQHVYAQLKEQRCVILSQLSEIVFIESYTAV